MHKPPRLLGPSQSFLKKYVPAADEAAPHQFFAPCPRGLEQVFEAELHELGIAETQRTDGGVAFRGPWSSMYRANLCSRMASRVLWKVGGAPYRTEQDVYAAARALPWHTWFTPQRTIKVKVSARHCPLPSLDFLTLRIKDAICDSFVGASLKRPSVNTAQPDVRIDAFLDERSITLYLDTSGEPLFKRGQRVSGADAPLRENLAAGIVRLAGWTPETVLLDAMCGSGTIVLEAACMARQLPAGGTRRFGFEQLLVHQPAVWERQRAGVCAAQRADAPTKIYASDRDPGMIRLAAQTFRQAGVAEAIHLEQCDILEREAPAESGVLIINPPYGVRLSHPEEFETFYPRLGDALKQRFAGWRAYVLTSDPRVPKLIGLTPTKRTPLFNGALECRLYEFILVQGSARRRLTGTATPTSSGPSA